MEGSREYMLDFVQKEKTVSFEKVFEKCADRIQALFLFLSMLELSQQRFMKLLVGEGRNNFIIEWNENRETELKEEGIDPIDLVIEEDDQIIINDVTE
jgi:segregation and condensation protein A